MATAQHSRTDGHEVCHGMVAIAYELERVSGLMRGLGAGLEEPLGDC